MTPVWLGFALWLTAVAVWRWQATSQVIDQARNDFSGPAGVASEIGPGGAVRPAGSTSTHQ